DVDRARDDLDPPLLPHPAHGDRGVEAAGIREHNPLRHDHSLALSAPRYPAPPFGTFVRWRARSAPLRSPRPCAHSTHLFLRTNLGGPAASVATAAPPVDSLRTQSAVSAPATVPSTSPSDARSSALATTCALPGGVRSTTMLALCATSTTNSLMSRRR